MASASFYDAISSRNRLRRCIRAPPGRSNGCTSFVTHGARLVAVSAARIRPRIFSSDKSNVEGGRVDGLVTENGTAGFERLYDAFAIQNNTNTSNRGWQLFQFSYTGINDGR